MTTDTPTLLRHAAGYALEYLDGINDRPVFPDADAIAALHTLGGPVPESPEDSATVLEALHRVASPATAASTSGRYFGFVVGGTLPVTIGAHWLATAWDQNAGGWTVSPLGAEMEIIAAGWLLDLMDLPRDAAVGFVTGATMAGFSALAAARAAVLGRQGWSVREQGLRMAPPVRIVTGAEAHTTIHKALRMLGFGTQEVEIVPTDAQGAMRADALPALDETTILILQAGNINSGACDPFTDIIPKARAAGAWVHVDGAFGLWGRAAPAVAEHLRGVEMADSWSVDAHKWLNVPYDSAVYICRDHEAVRQAFTADAAYLMRSDRREPSNLTPELSRRARAVEIWAAIRALGRAGIAQMVERCCAHARTFAHELGSAGFEIMNEVCLNQVCLRYRDDETTLAIMEAVQRDGTCWLGPTVWQGRKAFRISVSNWATTEEDVAATVAVLVAAARRFG